MSCRQNIRARTCDCFSGKPFILLPFSLLSFTDLFLFAFCLQIFVCLTTFRGAVCRKPSDGGVCFEPPQSFHPFLSNTMGEKEKEGRAEEREWEEGDFRVWRNNHRRENICTELKKWHFMSRKWASAWNSK